MNKTIIYFSKHSKFKYLTFFSLYIYILVAFVVDDEYYPFRILFDCYIIKLIN